MKKEKLLQKKFYLSRAQNKVIMKGARRHESESAFIRHLVDLWPKLEIIKDK